MFRSIMDKVRVRREGDKMMSLHKIWDEQRARAMSPSELAEIDAIFSRSL